MVRLQLLTLYYKRNYVLIFACILIFNQAKSQSEESLLLLRKTSPKSRHDSIYYELFKLNSNVDKRKAIYYSQLAYHLSDRYEHFLLQANVCYDLANLYDLNNQPDSSIAYYHKAIQISSLHKLNDWLIYLYNELGVLYEKIDVYDSALHYCTVSYNLAIEHKAFKGKAIASYNIGLVYSDLENYKEAVIHFKEAIQIKNSNGITQGLNLNLLNLARVLNVQGFYDDATDQLKKVKSNCKNGCDGIILADLNFEFGYSSLLKNKQKEASIFFIKALEISRKNNIKQTTANSLYHLSCIEFNREAYPESLKFLNEAEKIAIEINHRRLLKDIYLKYSELYNKKGIIGKELYYNAQYHQVKDSIFNQTIANSVNHIQLNEQGKRSNAIIEKQKTALSDSYIIIAMLTIIATLTFTVIFLIARALRSSRKHRQAMELHVVQMLDYREYSEKELFRTHMEFTSLLSRVIGFLNTPVTSLIGLANLVKSIGKPKEATDVMDRMTRVCNDILIVLKNMNDLILYKNHEVIAEEFDITSLVNGVRNDFKKLKSFLMLTVTVEPSVNRAIRSDIELIQAGIVHAIRYFDHANENPIVEIVFSQDSIEFLKITIKHHSTSNRSLPYRNQFNHQAVMVALGKLGGDFQVIQIGDYTLFEIFIPFDVSTLGNKTSKKNISLE